MLSLTIWNKPNSAETRIYLNGTPRPAVYLTKGDKGQTVWSSMAHGTPHKYQTGDHYRKVAKDREAARTVAEAFNITLGETPFDEALATARLGLLVEA